MTQRPEAYRAEIIGPLLTSLLAGECCNLIGTSGVGKSNLVQHLTTPAVLQYHLGDHALSLQFALVDANMITEWSGWGLFEGLLEALTASTVWAETDDGALVDSIDRAHRQVLAASGNYAFAFRQCAAVLRQLCRQRHVVLLFDESDALFARLDSDVLRNLRGLRDRHKYRLTYVAFSREPLADLRDDDDWEAVEPFMELFSLRELGLGPLAAPDALAEVARFAARYGRVLEAGLPAQIVAQSGGHPALLRAITQATLDAGTGADVPHLFPTIRLECVKIWKDLPAEEQDELLLTARGHDTQSLVAVQRLVLKGLIQRLPNGALTVFGPVLADYLRSLNHQGSNKDIPQPIEILGDRVRYYGSDISGQLRPLELRMLHYLWKHRNRICSVQEVAEAVYPGESNEDVERMRAVAKRLRRRLNQLAPDQPIPLTIYHARGYRLTGEVVTEG